MSGRPPNPDRQNAIALGLTTYIGTKHVRCDTTERYVAGGGCVHCGRLIATEQREALKFLKRAALDNAPEMAIEDDEAAAARRREESIDELM